MFFFNNCRGRDHQRIYGADAFYDLHPKTQPQAIKKAANFRPGDECIVATPIGNGQIRFTRFRMEREEEKPDEQGKLQKVFRGQSLQLDVPTKGDAARDALYSVFFKNNGDFKRQSVLQKP